MTSFLVIQMMMYLEVKHSWNCFFTNSPIKLPLLPNATGLLSVTSMKVSLTLSIFLPVTGMSSSVSRRLQHRPCGISTRPWPQLCPSSCVSSSASSWSPHRPPSSSQCTAHSHCHSQQVQSVLAPWSYSTVWVTVWFLRCCSTEATIAQGSAWTWGRWSPTSPASSAKTRYGWGGLSPARENTTSVWLWTTRPAWWTTTPNR